MRRKPTAPAVAANPEIVSWLDGTSRGRLHGWVHDRTRPLRRLAVEVVAASGRRLVAIADRYRADVHQAGLGDGYYGFSVPLHRLAGQGPVHVACIAPHVELGLVGTQDQGSGEATPRIFRRGAYTMQSDRMTGQGHIDGWAVDLSHPERRRVLRLRCDGRVLAQQRATRYRSEIADARCDGYHGFSFMLPGASRNSLVLEDIEAGLTFPILS